MEKSIEVLKTEGFDIETEKNSCPLIPLIEAGMKISEGEQRSSVF